MMETSYVTALREDRAARWTCVAVVAAVGLSYVLMASRTLVGGDSAEFAALSVHGGAGHPPGYPLFVLWLRATSFLPAVSAAHRAALSTALVATLSVHALQRACRAWGARPAMTAVASAIYAFSPLAFRLGTEPEVFALNVAIAMAIVALSAPEARAPRGSETSRVALLGLLAGLGISNHHTIVMLAPLGLYAAVRACLRSPHRWLSAVAGVLGLIVGLLPYAYLIHAARAADLRGAFVWGDPNSFDALLRHFLRKDYGTTSLAVSTAKPDPVRQWMALGQSLAFGTFGLLILVVPGAVALLRAPREGSPEKPKVISFAMLLASALLAGPFFVALFNLPSTGLYAHVVARFHLMPLALFVVLAAALGELVVAQFGAIGQRLLVLACVPLALGRAMVSWPTVAEGHRPTTEFYLGNVLATLPPRAIVLGAADDVSGSFLYAEAVGIRTDVDYINPYFLLTSWYPPQVTKRLGFEVERGVTPPGGTKPALGARPLLVQMLDTGRPVFVTDWFAEGIDVTFPSYPVGPLIRVVRSPSDVPPPEELLAMNEAAFQRFDIEAERPVAGTWAARRLASYARPWLVLANAFERRGDTARAEQCRRRAEAFKSR